MLKDIADRLDKMIESRKQLNYGVEGMKWGVTKGEEEENENNFTVAESHIETVSVQYSRGRTLEHKVTVVKSKNGKWTAMRESFSIKEGTKLDPSEPAWRNQTWHSTKDEAIASLEFRHGKLLK